MTMKNCGIALLPWSELCGFEPLPGVKTNLSLKEDMVPESKTKTYRSKVMSNVSKVSQRDLTRCFERVKGQSIF